jgi:hypothetical protein
VLPSPPRPLLQGSDVRRAALLACDALEILRDEVQELAESGVLGAEVAEQRGRVGIAVHPAKLALGGRSTDRGSFLVRWSIAGLMLCVLASGCARYEFRDASPSSSKGAGRYGWRLDRWTGEVCLFGGYTGVVEIGCDT